jgi:hypothetical protein
MDCLRSFNFKVDINSNLTGGFIKQWIVGVNQHFWTVTSNQQSTYNIQGFKNINVFGIDVVGQIGTLTTSGLGGVIVNDWSIDVLINGQQPLIGSNITVSPNDYSLNNTTASNRIFPLGKYSNSLKLADPIESVQSISLQQTYANGTGYETLGTINLFWKLNFIVYYKFEGE